MIENTRDERRQKEQRYKVLYLDEKIESGMKFEFVRKGVND